MNNFLLNAIAKPTLALCLLTASPILANPLTPDQPTGFQANISTNGINKIRVAIDKKTREPLTISLRPKGQSTTLFQQYMTKKQTQLALRLDVADLADGDYDVVVQSASGRFVKQLSVGSNRPVVAPERLVAIQ